LFVEFYVKPYDVDCCRSFANLGQNVYVLNISDRFDKQPDSVHQSIKIYFLSITQNYNV